MKRMSFSAGIVACLLLAGCGSGSADGGGDTTPPPPPPPPPAGIGTAGGTVTETSGAKVVIPSGALTASTDIKVTQTAAGAPVLPAGVTAFGQIYAFTPHGTAFAKPVTITVPFDPASVPSGTSPVLYKTDATLTTWTAVPGATVTGNTMSGDVTGFSDAVVASTPPVSQITPTLKHWQVDTYDHQSNLHNLLLDDQTGGVLELMDFLATPEGDLPTYYLHSTASGRTFWTQSVAPTGNSESIGVRTALTQTYYFKVNQESPALHFLITHASLKMFDGGGAVASQEACPWFDKTPDDDDKFARCNGYMTHAENTFRIEAHSLTSENPLFFRSGGTVEVGGLMRDWRPLVSASAAEHALFHFSDFDFDEDPDGDGTGRSWLGTLKEPKRVDVPISALHKGDMFAVEIFLKSTAINHIQGESLVAALLQDPLDNVGIDLETTGLEDLPPQPDAPVAPPALTCSTGPNAAAGKLQFSTAEFLEPERSESALIYVDRVGGSTGDISVRVTTSDSVATSGGDYESTSIELRFADGDDTRRRIEVPLVNDDAAEPDEALTVSLSDVGGCAQLGDPASATVTILDDDRPIAVKPTFTLGGTVTGLAGSGLHLQTNFINDVQPGADGAFTFPRRLDDGTAYSVTVVTQPANPAQICTVTNGSGTIADADVANVVVACTSPPPLGGIDTSFGSQGKVFTAFGIIRALTQQADGKLLVLGRTTINRFNPDGTPDTTFGTGGKIDLNTGGGSFDEFYSFVVQPDGKIVAAGEFTAPTVPDSDWVVFRFNADGTPDTTFGTGGRETTDFEGHFDSGRAVMLMADGKIVVAGYAQFDKIIHVGNVPVPIIDQDFAVVRYLPDGSLDATYGTGGKASLDVGGTDYLNAAVLNADGSVTGVGRVHMSGSDDPDIGVAKFLNNGIGDPAFGDGAIERINVGTGVVPPGFTGGLTDEALDVELDGGNILLAGYSLDSSAKSHGLLLRLSSTGAILHDFAPVIPSQIDRVNAVAVDGTRIVIAGTGQQDFGIARITQDGVLDSTFGTQGLMSVDFFGANDFATAVLVQSDGRYVAGGSAKNGTTGGSGLTRVNP